MKKKSKPLTAPDWDDPITPAEIEKYGPLAKNLAELTKQIKEAHEALRGCQDFTDRIDIPVYAEDDGRRLFAFDSNNRPYGEISMVLFNGTVEPVMRALCSAVKLKPSIDGLLDNRGDMFYHNLQNCLVLRY